MLTSSQLTPTATGSPLVGSHHHSSLPLLCESPNFFRRCSLVHPLWSLRLLTQLPLVCRWFLATLKILYFFLKLFFPLSRENSWYYCFLICSQKIVIKQTWASHKWYSWAHVCISVGAMFCVVGVLLLRTGLPISFEAHYWSQRRGRDPWWLTRVCVTSLLWSLPCPGPLQEYGLLALTHQLLVKVPIPLIAGISSRKEEILVWLSLCMCFCFSGCDQEPFMADGAAYMSSLFLVPVPIAYIHTVKSPGTSWHLWNVKCVCQWGKLNRNPVFLCELTLCYHLPSLVLYKMLCFLTGWLIVVYLGFQGHELMTFCFQGSKGLWGPSDKMESDHWHHHSYLFLCFTLT